MTNEELLGEISKLMQQQTERYESLLDERTNRFENLLEEHTLSINLKIENEVSKRIDSLFDGYMLTHEKQREMEQIVKALEERVDQLENAAS